MNEKEEKILDSCQKQLLEKQGKINQASQYLYLVQKDIKLNKASYDINEVIDKAIEMLNGED